jgi:hypothetical protein
MAPKNAYKVEGPDGSIFTRKTDRTYTHIVIGRGLPKNANPDRQGWEVVGWCGRYDLAVKKQGSREGRWYTETRIIEVPQPEGAN